MLTLSHYEIVQQIYESPNSIIYRGIRKHDNQLVILKMLKEDHPVPEELTRYRQEYEILKIFFSTGIIKAYGIEKYNNTIVIILEDFGGESLRGIIENYRVTIQEFLSLAQQLANSLGTIHAANIIHKDINSDNIVVNLATNQLKIIDFGIASRLAYENPSLENPERLEGTLAYLSPEQTGRINRRIDHRTDLYSMGVTFYELLTGRLPFLALDALELVHAHIAKSPPTVYEVAPHIPRIISDIVMKLLNKNAGDRYQSAFGVKADLEKCFESLPAVQKKTTLSFTLAQNDISGKFHIPQKLYGRKNEVNLLLQAFERVTQGATEMMLLAGYSGVGKTALVNEVHKPMTSSRGYFATGKFDQFQQNTPYSAITKAFNGFCRYLLMEKEEVLARWQARILAALGCNAQIIIDLIPTLELVIGAQPVVAEVGPTEGKNRFGIFFLKFVKVLCDKKHPIILFIDDLQWADSDSLILLKELVVENKIQHLFIIGAYRDNEVNSSHSFMLFVEELKKSNAVVNTIELKNLQQTDIDQLLQDSLACEAERTQPLSDVMYQKTQGNAFFTHQFLQVLNNEGILHFNFEQHQWQWDIKRIAEKNITDNVVDLLADKISLLPRESILLLELAACIGNIFDYSTLSNCYEHGRAKALSVLWNGIMEGLIQPLDENYKHIDSAENAKFKFSHDKIRQAAYALIPVDKKQAFHLQIGRLLLKHTPPDQKKDKIFDIIWHFNQALELISFQGERIEIARLNLQAGQKAKLAMADDAAITYLEAGRACLPENYWQVEYDLSLKIYKETIESLFLNGNFEQAEVLAELILQQCATQLDKIKVFEILIQLYMVKNQMQKALDTALQVLEILGVNLEKEPPKQFSVEKCYTLQKMTSPEQLAAMRILNFAISPSYVVAPEFFPQIVFTMVRLSVEYGNSTLSAFGYTTYASLLCTVFGEIEAGFQTGQLGLYLLNKSNSKALKAKVFASYNVTVHHWKRHAQETIEPLMEGSQDGLETGDLEFAGVTLMHCGSYLFLLGKPLPTVAQQHKKFNAFMLRVNLEYQLVYLNIWQQTVLNLQGKNTDPCRLTGSVFDENEVLPRVLESNYGMAIFGVYLSKVMLCYTFKDFDQAVSNAISAEKYEQANIGVMVVPVYKFYYSLALLATYLDASQKKQADILRKVEAHQEQMKLWAFHAPANYQHRYALVEAEKARCTGKPEAGEWYEEAINFSEKNEYLAEEALAYELASEFYVDRGMKKIAQTYLKEAYYAYKQWGARAKVSHLEKNYPELFIEDRFLQKNIYSATTAKSFRGSMLQASTQLDLTSVMKASQTLVKEIVLSKLLANMMRIVIENAGAQRGLLLLPQENK
ncbi:MAG: serine/threonine-protein kinase PknK [Candidatus Electrothrix sp. AR4]|nr:serine/threonine-protein kinase PknK [Candidatus Electrothrix sp. AR4]